MKKCSLLNTMAASVGSAVTEKPQCPDQERHQKIRSFWPGKMVLSSASQCVCESVSHAASDCLRLSPSVCFTSCFACMELMLIPLAHLTSLTFTFCACLWFGVTHLHSESCSLLAPSAGHYFVSKTALSNNIVHLQMCKDTDTSNRHTTLLS